MNRKATPKPTAEPAKSKAGRPPKGDAARTERFVAWVAPGTNKRLAKRFPGESRADWLEKLAK